MEATFVQGESPCLLPGGRVRGSVVPVSSWVIAVSRALAELRVSLRPKGLGQPCASRWPWFVIDGWGVLG